MIVEIHWIDSIDSIDSMGSSGWNRPNDLEKCDMSIETVGILVQETDDAYIVATSRCSHNLDVHGGLKIPKVAVIEFWELTF